MSIEVSGKDYMLDDSTVEILTQNIRKDMLHQDNPAKRKLKTQHFKYYQAQIGVQQSTQQSLEPDPLASLSTLQINYLSNAEKLRQQTTESTINNQAILKTDTKSININNETTCDNSIEDTLAIVRPKRPLTSSIKQKEQGRLRVRSSNESGKVRFDDQIPKERSFKTRQQTIDYSTSLQMKRMQPKKNQDNPQILNAQHFKKMKQRALLSGMTTKQQQWNDEWIQKYREHQKNVLDLKQIWEINKTRTPSTFANNEIKVSAGPDNFRYQLSDDMTPSCESLEKQGQYDQVITQFLFPHKVVSSYYYELSELSIKIKIKFSNAYIN